MLSEDAERKIKAGKLYQFLEQKATTELREQLAKVQGQRDELRRKAEFCELFERGGWFVEHCPPSSYLTDEANAEHAFMVRRTMPPFEVNKTRHWTGPTPTEALKRAAAAIARTEGEAP